MCSSGTPELVLLFGGTFDPVHHGHLRSALELTQLLPASKLHLVPCLVPAHRQQPTASAAQRLAMLQLAVAGETQLYVDDREIQRQGISWTVDTLLSLRQDYNLQQNPANQPTLALVLGWDAFCGLTSWSRYEQVLELAHLIVLTRPGQMHPAPESIQELLAAYQVPEANYLTSSPAGKILCLSLPSAMEISATYIRQLIASQQSTRYLLPETVRQFIAQHGLYQTPPEKKCTSKS